MYSTPLAWSPVYSSLFLGYNCLCVCVCACLRTRTRVFSWFSKSPCISYFPRWYFEKGLLQFDLWKLPYFSLFSVSYIPTWVSFSHMHTGWVCWGPLPDDALAPHPPPGLDASVASTCDWGHGQGLVDGWGEGVGLPLNICPLSCQPGSGRWAQNLRHSEE